ncbi:MULTISPECIES: siroheme synthase CysG [Aliiglaciecola]|uniref:siroheme synthase CysG n=1 Tax=Aliiglaciecola TaxID=1406885 RepID=UPI001C08AA6F|nr:MULTISPECIES: siroheme synthase CysG [Aliiglaciecola]MBU2878707.1 siroheme synthase CysG [Aliiglaciecola lipolytica]MDO6711397.1 siroheme synthase CysG [Aliiglaciecola sp. 2_MG-2023]MDO6752154.1 siroheme synthase CysG [Aliiglaciecola sp. 1_MG-2023]
MRYFPIFIDTQKLNCLVVGAGEVAARKIELLLKSEAKITVVAPWMCNTVAQFAEQGLITVISREFSHDDITQRDLIFVATDSSEVNQQVHKLASDANILVNVVDNTPLCKFITPSIIDRSPIVIAMSSGGVAPVLLRYLRQKLESYIPQKTARLGQFSEKFRELVKQKLSTVTARRFFWEDILDGPVAEQVFNGNQQKAEALFAESLENHQQKKVHGEVYLVGAGPGDPDLLTFKALRLMQKADVVVYDRLVSKEVLELVRRDAEKIYVGKAKSQHTLPQQDINVLLADLAAEGKRVVRLKGGDPFIFGRGGEEIETLVSRNIAFQVVPGITAATGAASYAGIPLTHRDHAQSVVFATGHLKDNTIDLDWPALVQKNQTIVFYMGITGLTIIRDKLIEHGMPKDMPIAMVQSATTDKQKVVTGSLATIQELAAAADIKPPSLIIIGTVVTLRDKLNWFLTEQTTK